MHKQKFKGIRISGVIMVACMGTRRAFKNMASWTACIFVGGNLLFIYSFFTVHPSKMLMVSENPGHNGRIVFGLTSGAEALKFS